MNPVEALSEALDDAITMARVNRTLEDTDAIAAQTLSVLSELGWVLVCTDEPEDSETVDTSTTIDVFSVALERPNDV